MSGFIRSGFIRSVGGLLPSVQLPPHIQSGQLLSGLAATWHFPCQLGSGAVNPGWNDRSCWKCKKPMGSHSGVGDTVVVTGVSGLSVAYCWGCAGFLKPQLDFETREDWIRDTVPLPQDTPASIIADYLRDQSRYKDSDYMLSIAQRTSGG